MMQQVLSWYIVAVTSIWLVLFNTGPRDTGLRVPSLTWRAVTHVRSSCSGVVRRPLPLPWLVNWAEICWPLLQVCPSFELDMDCMCLDITWASGAGRCKPLWCSWRRVMWPSFEFKYQIVEAQTEPLLSNRWQSIYSACLQSCHL